MTDKMKVLICISSYTNDDMWCHKPRISITPIQCGWAPNGGGLYVVINTQTHTCAYAHTQCETVASEAMLILPTYNTLRSPIIVHFLKYAGQDANKLTSWPSVIYSVKNTGPFDDSGLLNSQTMEG